MAWFKSFRRTVTARFTVRPETPSPCRLAMNPLILVRSIWSRRQSPRNSFQAFRWETSVSSVSGRLPKGREVIFIALGFQPEHGFLCLGQAGDVFNGFFAVPGDVLLETDAADVLAAGVGVNHG